MYLLSDCLFIWALNVTHLPESKEKEISVCQTGEGGEVKFKEKSGKW